MRDADVEKVLIEAREVSLSRGMMYFSHFISNAPKERIQINAYNKYGWISEANKSYAKELTVWKNTKLFPFFLANGWTKQELNEAWKKSVFKK
jgi:hypothetical protein